MGFSLVETADGNFLYQCHACGSEIKLIAADQKLALVQAAVCSQRHQCASTNTPSGETPKVR